MTWVGLTMLAAILGGAYLAWTWFPVYYLHYEVRQVVRDFGHQAVKEPDDARLVAGMVERLRRLGQVAEVEDGQVRSRPLVDVRPEDVTWERQPPNLHVAFSYERPVLLPLSERRLSRVLDVDLDLDIAREGWGETR